MIVLKIDKDGVESGIDQFRSFSMRGENSTLIIEYQDTKEVQKFEFYDKEQAVAVFDEVVMIMKMIDPDGVIEPVRS